MYTGFGIVCTIDRGAVLPGTCCTGVAVPQTAARHFARHVMPHPPPAYLSTSMKNRVLSLCVLTVSTLLALPSPSWADVAPEPREKFAPPGPVSNRDPVALARRDAEVSKLIAAARGGESNQTGPARAQETSALVRLGESCGFAGCSSSSLVVFSFRSRGANPQTKAVLALVTCPSVPRLPCTVSPAEVRATGPQQQQGPGAATQQ